MHFFLFLYIRVLILNFTLLLLYAIVCLYEVAVHCFIYVLRTVHVWLPNGFDSLKPGSQYDVEPTVASHRISTHVHVGAVNKCNT